MPSGKKTRKNLKSPHYKDGKSKKLNPTPQLAEDTSMPKKFSKFLFSKVENATPKEIPFHQNRFKNLNPKEKFLRLDGTFLIFSSN